MSRRPCPARWTATLTRWIQLRGRSGLAVGRPASDRRAHLRLRGASGRVWGSALVRWRCHLEGRFPRRRSVGFRRASWDWLDRSGCDPRCNRPGRDVGRSWPAQDFWKGNVGRVGRWCLDRGGRRPAGNDKASPGTNPERRTAIGRQGPRKNSICMTTAIRLGSNPVSKDQDCILLAQRRTWGVKAGERWPGPRSIGLEASRGPLGGPLSAASEGLRADQALRDARVRTDSRAIGIMANSREGEGPWGRQDLRRRRAPRPGWVSLPARVVMDYRRVWARATIGSGA